MKILKKLQWNGYRKGFSEGFKSGSKEGMKILRKNIAQKMFEKGKPLEEIIEFSGLTHKRLISEGILTR